MSASVRYRIKGTRLYVQPVQASAQPFEAGSAAPRLARWRPSHGGPNVAAGGALPTMRARSRDARRNDGLADSVVETLVTNIVGTGIKPQFATPDAAFNQTLAEAFAEWTDEADADGQADFYGQQALAVGSMIEGGDCFGRLRTRRLSDGLSVPLQVQLLEAEYCPDEKNEMIGGSGAIRAGVEFDAIGRRTAYHLYRQHPNDWSVNGFLADFAPVRVPATEVCHLTSIRRPGQIRGEPWTTRALVKLHELDKYDDAQLVRQQIAALFAGFVKLGVDPEAQAELFGKVTQAGEVALSSLEPGTLQVLPPGYEINFSAPPSPGDSYETFMRQQARRVAVAAGVLYEQATGDYSQVNDRTFRASVNEFRRRCTMWQHHIVVFRWCRPILARWATLAVLSGRITPPKGITPAMIARAKWVPQGWAYINPQQDIAATTAEIRAGLKSRAAAVSERGDDVEQVDAEIAADNARADRLGLMLASDPRRTSGAGVTQARPSGSGFPSPEDAPPSGAAETQGDF